MLQLAIKGHKIDLSLSDCSAKLAAVQISKFSNATGSKKESPAAGEYGHGFFICFPGKPTPGYRQNQGGGEFSKIRIHEAGYMAQNHRKSLVHVLANGNCRTTTYPTQENSSTCFEAERFRALNR